jgi:hypothetical protein
VHADGQWLLHCGDAYTDRAQIDDSYGKCPLGPKIHRLSTVIDKKSDLKSKELLRNLIAKNSNEIKLFCSHDTIEFKQLTNSWRAKA